MAVKSSMVTEATDSDYLKKKKKSAPSFAWMFYSRSQHRQAGNEDSQWLLSKVPTSRLRDGGLSILKAADNKD